MLDTVSRGLPPFLVALSLVVLTVVFQNCGEGFKAEPPNVLRIDSITCGPDGCTASEPALIQCDFNEFTLSDGQTITAYEVPTVPFGQTCNSETRTCNGGQLSGTFPESQCSSEPGASCGMGDMTITHGTTLLAWAEESVVAGIGSCQSEERICNNGNINGSFQYTSCVERQPNDCVLDGQTVANGSAIPAYNLPSVPFGTTCQQESRNCSDGNLSGTYAYGSCTVSGPSGCSLDGVTVSHGVTITAYQNSSVPMGSTCQTQERSCDNGALSGNYPYSTCAIEGATELSRIVDTPTVIEGDAYLASPQMVVLGGTMVRDQMLICAAGGVLDGTLSPGADQFSTAGSTSFDNSACPAQLSISTSNSILVSSTLVIRGRLTLSGVSMIILEGGKVYVDSGKVHLGPTSDQAALMVIQSGAGLYLRAFEAELGILDTTLPGALNHGAVYNQGTIYFGGNIPDPILD